MKHQGFLSTSDKPHYENVPFEVPSSWVWTTVGDIAESNIGLTYKPSDICDDGVPVYRSNNIQNRRIDKTELVRVNAKILDKQYLAVGDLLICARNGSRRLVGKCALIENLSEPSAFGAFMAVCRSAYNPWIYLLLNTGYFNRYLDDSNSTAINQVTQSMLLAFRVPFPPKKEQDRIIYEISKWFDLIDTIEKSKEELQVIISTTKSKILDLAIHGKLVPQDPTDEPASELLKRINPKAGTASDNGHYQKLPEGWCVCHINEISESLLGKILDRTKDCGEFKRYVCAVNVQLGYFDFTTQKRFRIEAKDFERYAVKKGDLLICEGGDVGRCAIWDTDTEMYYQNALHRVRCKFGISEKYLQYSLWHFKLNGVIDSLCKGVTIKHFTQSTMNKLEIPLPPFAEQQRIVAKIEELFHQFDMIEESL